MAIKYKARVYRNPDRKFDCGSTIEAVNIERESDKSVWIRGERHIKRSDFWPSYFDSFEEAQADLIKHQQKRIESLEERLTKAREVLDEIKRLREEQA